MNARLAVTIPFHVIEEHEVRMAERDEQLAETQALIDNLDGLPESPRIQIPNPEEVHLIGWFTRSHLRALADYMEKSA